MLIRDRGDKMGGSRDKGMNGVRLGTYTFLAWIRQAQSGITAKASCPF